MQDLPRDEEAANVVVEAREVPAIEVVKTTEVPAIEVERTRAEPTEGVRTPPAKEEAEEGESLGSHMVECAKLTHEWVEVSLLPCSVYVADLFLQALSCNAWSFFRLWWSYRSSLPRSLPRGAPPSVGWRSSRLGWPSSRRGTAS